MFSFERNGRIYQKEVTYFLAEASGTERRQEEEVAAMAWTPWQSVEEQLTYESSKELWRSLLQIASI